MEGTMATILLFAGTFAPRNWGYCDGSVIAISSNSALFSLLGTTYGGNGTTTFALPDLRGRVAVGTGNGPGLSPYVLGQAAGTENVTLTINQMPAHTHMVSVPVSGNSPSTEEPDGAILANTGANLYAGVAAKTGDYGGVTATPVGGNQPVNILQPYLALNYVICMQGIYPSRN